MKKPIYLLMPLMCISFLASCGKVEPEPPKTYTITFKNDSDEDKKIENIEAGSIVTENIPVPSQREGSTFIGWCTDTESKYVFDFSKVKIFQDYTLYSGWKENEPGPVIHKLSFSGEHLTLKDESGTPIEEKEYENGTILKLTLEPDDEQYIYPTQEDLLIMDKEGNPYDPTLYLYDQARGELMITIKDDIDISATTYNPYISGTEELEYMLTYFMRSDANYTAHFVDGYNFPLYDIQVSPNITHFHGYNECDNSFGVIRNGFSSPSLTSDTYIETIEKDDGTYEYYQYQPYGQKFDESDLYTGRGVLDDIWYKESIDSQQASSLTTFFKTPLGEVLYRMSTLVYLAPIEFATFIDNHYEMRGIIPGESTIYDYEIYAVNHQLTKLSLHIYSLEESMNIYTDITFTYGNAPTTPPEVADSIDYEVTEEEWNNITDNILDEGPLTIDSAIVDSDLKYHIGFDGNYLNFSTFFDTDEGYRIARFLPYENSQFNKDYYYYGEYGKQELSVGASCVSKMPYDEEMPFEKLYSIINSFMAPTVEFINNQYDHFTYQEEQKKYTNNESFVVMFEDSGETYEVTYDQVEVQFINGHLASVKSTSIVSGDPEPTTYITSLSYKDVKVMPPIQL